MTARPGRNLRAANIVGTCLLAALTFALASLASRFTPGVPPEERPLLTFVLLLMASGAVYLVLVFRGQGIAVSRGLLIGAFAVGLAMRAAFFFSTPVQEDDWCRYLWDGAVTAHGLNPWRWSPDQALNPSAEADIPAVLAALANAGGELPGRVNHPKLRTIYPPTAQAAFALTYWIRPFSLTAWRGVILILDLGTLGLLIALLARAGASPATWAIYWLNPLVVKEFYNSAHMDIVALVFVTGAFLAAANGRKSLGATALALAVGAKLWPLLLFPLIFRDIMPQPRRLARPLIIFLLLTAALYYPVFSAGVGVDSGFRAFAARWEMNDALFLPLLWLCRSVLSQSGAAQLAARATAGLALAGFALFLYRRPAGNVQQTAGRCLALTAAVFLLSPAQFPWYYSWVVLFLPFRPRLSLALLTVLLPIYYLRFYLDARGAADLFDSGLVWLEYAPVWALLAWEQFREKKKPQEASS